MPGKAAQSMVVVVVVVVGGGCQVEFDFLERQYLMKLNKAAFT